MKKQYYLWGIVCICLYYVPVLILGESSSVLIHDNLDGEFIFRLFMNLKDGTAEYSSGMIHSVMNGLPREMIQSGWNVTAWLFGLFTPFTAYMVNDWLARMVGFLGMALLLDAHLIGRDMKYRTVIILVSSLTFAVLGSYNIYCGLTVMGQPMLLYVFWNLANKRVCWWCYLIIGGFALWSSFMLSGLFICLALGIWWLWLVYRDRRSHLSFLFGILLLGVCYLAVEHQMILSAFSSGVISHRVEFRADPAPLAALLKGVVSGALLTQYHAGTLCTVPIIGLFIWGWILRGRRVEGTLWLMIGIIAGIVVEGFVYQYLVQGIGAGAQFLVIFQWDRFYFLLPLLWIMLMAGSAQAIVQSGKRYAVYLAGLMVVMVVASVAWYNIELRTNGYRLLGGRVGLPDYGEFFDPDLFEKVADHIGKPQSSYRVVSLGMYPSIATYNGFFTADGYLTSYPLEYKHRFREVIAGELGKSPELRDYFDHWGSRCYIFSAELGRDFLCGKDRRKGVRDLNIDTARLRQLGAEYVISAVEILHAEQVGLVLDGVFEGDFWKIYLYKISDHAGSRV